MVENWKMLKWDKIPSCHSKKGQNIPAEFFEMLWNLMAFLGAWLNYTEEAKRARAELCAHRLSCWPPLAHSLDFSDTLHELVCFCRQKFRGSAAQTRDCTKQDICAWKSSENL